MTLDDDRINYLAGADGESLSASERAELDEVRALLAAPATWTKPDSGVEDRVVAAIAEEARERPAGAPAGAPVAADGAPATAAGGTARPARRRRSFAVRWPAYSLAGVAAAIVAAAVIAVSVGGGGPKAERFAMIVYGTDLAEGAHGSATLTKTASGWRIDLAATGLPHLASGSYYEAWLKNAAGLLVPVGTFNDARRVTLWSGVPVAQFPTLTVTQQLADGNPASSGRRVLTGTITDRR